MSDKNITPEEDYLDSLLRSIAGGADEEEIDDNLIAEDIDFDKEVDGGMSEDEFLSDFEKEFFGADIDDNAKVPVPELVQDPVMFQAEESFPDFEMIEEMESSKEMVESKSQTLQEKNKEQEIQTVPEMQLEAEEKFEAETQLESDLQLEPALQLEKESYAEPEITANDDFDLAEDIMNVSDEQAMVEEAIASEDSSVEADLQGLYGILGMGNAEQELPADIEDTPKKKKGLFSKKDKKDKKEKKEKKKKGKKKKDLEEEVANTLVIEGEGLEDFDFSDFSLDALSGPDGGSLDSSESAFDMTALDDGNSENGDLGLGFDDSIFGGLEENGGNAEVVFDEDPFGDEEIDEEAELKAKKKQEKKEAKEKKKKEKEQAKKEKEKEKEKKKKPKKAPKPKKVKEPDEIINISPIFIVFALSFVIIVILVANIGGNYYHYNERFYDAVSLYVYGNNLDEGEILDQEAYEDKFSDAYNLIYGLEMKEKDHQVFYDQLTTIMLMDRHYEAYKSFMLNDDYAHGLDSLIKAIKMYDKYQNDARELKCFDEMTVVLGWVENKLMSTYGLSVSEARDLSMIKDDDDYAVKVRAIAAKAEAENNKNKVDEE